ncbi:hypothetical protein BASA81_010537 [Batrachochytrium salamandrivorans]|nr:hypothetical protein BASA81_010537 [Batrachochytrium salamandrivorans]
MQDEEEEESVAKLTDNVSALGEEAGRQRCETQIPQTDPVLDAFDRLRVREVMAGYSDTASTFLTKFQSIAANLQPDEKIELKMTAARENTKSLKAVLSDPQANKICALRWHYNEEGDVNSVVPLLIHNCPELASLYVYSKHHSASDFVSSVLEHSSNKIKVLTLPRYTRGNIPRFFAALGQSQVSALNLSIGDSPEFAQGLFEYLTKDLLVRFKVWGCNQVLLMSLSKCTRLAKLELIECEFSQLTAFTHLPKSITKLELKNCTFVGGFDWSFLSDSNVQELTLHNVRGVEGNRLGGALAVHLRAKGLDRLRFSRCDFVDETLAVIGVDISRIKRLMLENGRVNDAYIKLIALALQSPNSELKDLRLWYDDMASSIETHLVPALKHPNCNLAKLSLSTYGGGAKVAEHFHKRLALFVLLQGRQVKRRYCPLRRLPMEMLRLVGKALI